MISNIYFSNMILDTFDGYQIDYIDYKFCFQIETTFNDPKPSVVLEESDISRNSSFVITDNICFK